mmetsp:Transcript_38024/g.112573  ORF Transcript_38024/g.112573 Transcript_38024/m.112573 type:complete len:239 (+) Transcript_38024:304-1020(+)
MLVPICTRMRTCLASSGNVCRGSRPYTQHGAAAAVTPRAPIKSPVAPLCHGCCASPSFRIICQVDDLLQRWHRRLAAAALAAVAAAAAVGQHADFAVEAARAACDAHVGAADLDGHRAARRAQVHAQHGAGRDVARQQRVAQVVVYKAHDRLPQRPHAILVAVAVCDNGIDEALRQLQPVAARPHALHRLLDHETCNRGNLGAAEPVEHNLRAAGSTRASKWCGRMGDAGVRASGTQV